VTDRRSAADAAAGEAERGELAYPAQLARTRRFSLGHPRSFRVAADGSRVAFLRSRAGDDPVTCLWMLDVASAAERLVVDPRELRVGEAEDAVTEAERSRRERARESAEGIVAYATDRDLRRACFALDGRPFVVEIGGGGARPMASPGPVDDPRLDPAGRRIAYVVNGSLFVQELDGAARMIAGGEAAGVTWGLAEFVAAEEMDRLRGYWWSPDGGRIAAARVDDRPLPTWYVGDPTEPDRPPRSIRYPAAGRDNASVTLAVLDTEGGGRRVDVVWDAEAYPYLARVVWAAAAPLTLLVQSRDQRIACVLEVDDETGATDVIHRETDAAWVELVPGSPARTADGRLVMAADRDGARRLVVGGDIVTDESIQVRSVVAADRDVTITASRSDTPDVIDVCRVRPDTAAAGTEILTAPGVSAAAVGGDTVVVVTTPADEVAPVARVEASDPIRPGEARGVVVASVGELPLVDPRPEYVRVGERDLRCALLFPRDRVSDSPLPVLLDPYGGPHHQRVVRTRGAYLTSQWFADRGFAVLVADGRGTPGRGPSWERSIRGDLALALEDQVDALFGVAKLRPGALDLARVAIRGWSFGGYLAALAVLRRPDVFHAAIAGAPVTDWRLYDTHYTERYLGLPDEEPLGYERSSIVDDAAALVRPLLIVHGLADDNVVAAHSLRLSAALFDAARPHELVLLPKLTHMAAGRSTDRSLLALELDFLRRSLRGAVGDAEEAPTPA
jgi:dipeptidyl-peptidase 4